MMVATGARSVATISLDFYRSAPHPPPALAGLHPEGWPVRCAAWVPLNMSTTTRALNAAPDQVWDVLADGWLYPLWVVGASRIRGVDPRWPAAGTELHHSVGVWPGLIDDSTQVMHAVPGRSIALRGRGWPLGEADIVIRLRASGTGTEVEIEEDAVAGPGRLIPEPLRGRLISWRNVETLRRLAFVVEGRERATAPSGEVPGPASGVRS